MVIKLDDLKRTYLLVALAYYMGFIGFFVSFIVGGKGDDAFSANASGSIVNQLVGVSLLLMSIFLLIKTPTFSLNRAIKQAWLWIVLIGYFLLSVTWSYAPQITFRRVIAFSTLIIVAYCLVEFFTIRSLLSLLSAAAGFAAVTGLVYALLAPDKAFVSEGIRATAFLGMYFDKNGGARIYAYAILLILGLGFYQSTKQKVLLAALIVCVLMSRSATATVMIVFGGVIAMVFKIMHSSSPKKNLWRLVILLVGLVLGGVIVNLLYEFILSLLGRDPSLTNRVIIWELLDTYVQAEWLKGYGFGAFWSSSAVSDFIERWGFIGNAHSGYYEALLHGGIIGLGLVFVIVMQPLIRFSKHYIYAERGDVVASLLPIILIQIAVNYVGYVIINHNSFDMFIFVLIFFIASKVVQKRDDILQSRLQCAL